MRTRYPNGYRRPTRTGAPSATGAAYNGRCPAGHVLAADAPPDPPTCPVCRAPLTRFGKGSRKTR